MSEQYGAGDEDARKLFVGGLPTEATKEDVETYFATFGEVQMCTVKTDVYSGRSRGFGFVIYKDVAAVRQVLSGGVDHSICGKHVDPKLATPQESKEKNFKIFVGGLDPSTRDDDVKSTFAKRGEVTEVFLPTDKTVDPPKVKGFAFVTFADSEIADTLISEGKAMVNGKELGLLTTRSVLY